MAGGGNTGKGQDGPRRVQKVLGEIFEFFVAHGQVKNIQLADKTIQMTANKLGQICQDCQMNLLGSGEVDESAAQPAKGNEKRRLFLLRLISCKASHLFDKTHNPNPMDRAYAMGLDLYFRRIFPQAVYLRLNGEAKQVLNAAPGSDDVQIFNMVNVNSFFSAFMQNVLIRLALSFRDYEQAKSLFMQDVNDALPSGYADMTNDQFRVLMSALLFDTFMKGKSELDGKLLDFRYGAKTAEAINALSERFNKDR